jgi:multidrug efflux pump subunit AcrB
MAGLLLLVIVIIYSLCAVIFESLRKPFVILLLIPVGFIGLFLTFAIGKFTFDQGGFASMVMMCGIVVNAGIYIVNEYNIIRRAKPGAGGAATYVKAYNRKIIPTLLTIVSTVLGLIPFLFDGTDTVFWFAFAVGVMGSMLLSILALVIYFPVFFPFGRES